jgi:hypothetical protein
LYCISQQKKIALGGIDMVIFCLLKNMKADIFIASGCTTYTCATGIINTDLTLSTYGIGATIAPEWMD